ncbi:MAG TPA: BrnT family toxin [Terracidiphilus sp.]|jgi:hypothetical protein|nr:BrnT family toxin [Terracidiphilus sp.]
MTTSFDWDRANINHVAEHNVTPEEAEEIILGDPLELGFDMSILGEDRWSYVGETVQGRVLQVIITLRGERIRVVTAFEPTKRDKLSYLEYKAERQ